MKKRIGILGTALLALTLTACGSGAAGQAQYIGLDAAKAVALEAAGVQEGEATFSTTGLDKQNGMDFYAVDFTANGEHYEYDIDAVTGVIIDSDTPETRAAAAGEAASPAPEASPSPSASPQSSPAASPASTP
ncbi:PepSY domain-containing protein, partial [Pseudoflavonifractor phocaeensis]|uniref:PepSY domain-containing protein n=1 Tax=Pseudoflavonifractor phocaeensis TaxID=1870988 RepID=UPI0019578775